MKRLVTIVSVVAVFTAGCMREEAPPIHTYTLRIPSVSAVNLSPFKEKVLKISYPQSLLENISDKMVYAYNDDERDTYLHSRWASDIGQMLQGVLIETLEQSRAFKAVLPYNSTATEDIRLEVFIYDFSHHIRGKRSYASFSVGVSLIDTYTGKLIKSSRFTYKEPTPTVDAKGYVSAVNRIIHRFSSDLLHWIVHEK